jgi:hypothetical protein
MKFLINAQLSSHLLEDSAQQLKELLTQQFELLNNNLFSFTDSQNLMDFTTESNINRMISILSSNVKQWSFIESQLLEPNVNLAMVRTEVNQYLLITVSHFIITIYILA